MLKISSSGAKVLNEKVCCDGFYVDSIFRIQTHAHSDHTNNFKTSLNRNIIATKPTISILSEQLNLPFLEERRNVFMIGRNETKKFDNCMIEFKDAVHMIGSVQAKVEYDNGLCFGYSGDFSHKAIDNPIDVDHLIVDATYGDPDAVRTFSQERAKQGLIDIIGDHYLTHPIYIKSHIGTLHHSLTIINNIYHFLPILISKKDKIVFDIYNKNGYDIDNIYIDKPYDEEIINIKESRKYIKLFSTKNELPSDTSDHISINLKSIFHRNSGPVTKHGENHYTIAISDHADFKETIDYIETVNPKFVLTDSSTNLKYASKLSSEIKRILNIKSESAKIEKNYAYGR